MRKTFWFVGALGFLTSTAAWAENWVHADQYSLYDRDSAYVEAQSGLVYVTVCNSTTCTSGAAGNDTSLERLDCATRTASNYVEGTWQPPASEGDGLGQYSPQSTIAAVIGKVCAQKASLPSR